MRPSPAELIPPWSFMATQFENLPDVAGPAGLMLLGVYTAVYVIKALGDSKTHDKDQQTLKAELKHIEKTLEGIAKEVHSVNERLKAHGDRLTRVEMTNDNHSHELARIRSEGCQQLQKHMDVLRRTQEGGE